MNITEQGVRQQQRKYLSVRIFFLFIFCISQCSYAGPLIAKYTARHEKSTPQPRVFVIYNAGNKLHASIIKKLAAKLSPERPGITLEKIAPEQKIKSIRNDRDIIISIGSSYIKSIEKNYPNTKKIFIATAPNQYPLNTNKKNITLYMTQSYCRQIKFITLLNTSWETIGILSSKKNPVNINALQQCANKYNIKLYTINGVTRDRLSSSIKNVLTHSDVLLALPDNNIYNSRTVKNILLTSYRYRKPVIAFSKNFVNAGALAAIHSDVEQIIQTANSFIKQQLDPKTSLPPVINHPKSFKISINRQVFRALDLVIPDTEKLSQALQKNSEEPL